MFLVLVMMTVAVAACGKSGNKESSKNKNGEETETEEAKPVYQFTIWGSKADLSAEKGSWLKTRCDMFAAKHQDAELEFKYAAYTCLLYTSRYLLPMSYHSIFLLRISDGNLHLLHLQNMDLLLYSLCHNHLSCHLLLFHTGSSM